MRITRLEADGFKNLCEIALEPDASYNLILGENAQGKTNLLEAIWALTGCRSFRGTHERDYLPFSGDTLRVEAKFQDARRQQSVRLAMAKGSGAPEKKFWCNDVPQRGSGSLFSVFHCVVFTPEDLSLVGGGPERRRSFLDLCSAQLSAPVLALVRRYQLVLQQEACAKAFPQAVETAAGIYRIFHGFLHKFFVSTPQSFHHSTRKKSLHFSTISPQRVRGRKISADSGKKTAFHFSCPSITATNFFILLISIFCSFAAFLIKNLFPQDTCCGKRSQSANLSDKRMDRPC